MGLVRSALNPINSRGCLFHDIDRQISIDAALFLIAFSRPENNAYFALSSLKKVL